MTDDPTPVPEQLNPEPIPPPPSPGENPAWTIWDVLFLGGFILAAVLVTQFLAIAVAHYFRPSASLDALAKSAKILVPAQFAAYALGLLAMVAVVRTRGGKFWRSIRWIWPSRPATLVIVGIALSFAIRIGESLLPLPKETPFEKYFSDAAAAYMLAVFGTFVAPLLEELFFRGFMYPAVARHIGSAGSVVITSLVFALIHAPQYSRAWAPMLLLFLVGVVLTLVRVRTGSVAASFLVHAGYNFSLFAVMYIASDHFRNLENMR